MICQSIESYARMMLGRALSIIVHKECNHLCHERFRHKNLYYNVFEKNHAAGLLGFGSITKREVGILLRLTIIGKASIVEQATKLVRHDLGAIPVRESKEAMDEMTYLAIHEIVVISVVTRKRVPVTNNQAD
ncbi:hypothetical protein TIFTF001_029757 [Ficus carica]|uniref:Uncharacterized protein n=1 Tax=Ficus carica TaxID=3494 RepID=A0AA88IYK1_FICCA|nr:hypothetical protein TIFTF001_029757 [Ficus carica]